jgi:hypothetical protein
MSETWELFALKHARPQHPPKKFLHGNSTVQVESEHSTLHTKHNLEKKNLLLPAVPTHKKTREGPFTPLPATSHSLHGNSIPNIGCHYFWPGLIALPKNTLPYLFTNFATSENLEMAKGKKD